VLCSASFLEEDKDRVRGGCELSVVWSSLGGDGAFCPPGLHRLVCSGGEFPERLSNKNKGSFRHLSSSHEPLSLSSFSSLRIAFIFPLNSGLYFTWASNARLYLGTSLAGSVSFLSNSPLFTVS
jgi:hypothetical protein